MKAFKFTLIAALVLGGLLSGVTLAGAQDAKEAQKSPKGPILGQRMAAELKLTDEQKPKFNTILEERAGKYRELRAQTSLNQDQRLEKIKAIQDETNQKMKAVLMPEQYEKWVKMQPQLRKRPVPGEEKKGESQKPKA